MIDDIKDFLVNTEYDLTETAINELANFLMNEKQWINLDVARSDINNTLSSLITSHINNPGYKSGVKQYINGYDDGLIEAKKIIRDQLE